MQRESVHDLVQRLAEDYPYMVDPYTTLVTMICSDGRGADAAVAALAAVLARGAWRGRPTAQASVAWRRAMQAAHALDEAAAERGVAARIVGQPSALPALVAALQDDSPASSAPQAVWLTFRSVAPGAALLRGPGLLANAAADALNKLAAEAPSAVAAALAAPSGGPRARALLQQLPLSLPAEAAGALSLAAARAAALGARAAALEALAAAAGQEAEAARPKACVACGQEAGPGVRLRPCAGCAGGPAGRVLYCGATCQGADWGRHKAFCKLAAAAAKEDAAAGSSEDC
ncbi:hypothetical protein Rsub_01830 [Raphidocelis subcapitata]|uniref:MYND-type domain-containing protein n=1 Tax=Raphidocelis subcapitata TaxID=307507 RepID=A0A2V0NU87_9CHLO|nr:hypothetical protein Rsub_01830 [Raphidocelis subcapitata]|eukprot:GBF89113.1 hypothetical protein Rsub_01830 [Raphidocelis subcapitata]